jgi:cytoplasmic FMR1 interacting protein
LFLSSCFDYGHPLSGFLALSRPRYSLQEDAVRTSTEWINMLYTYRSCSRALPQVKDAGQENKNEIYEGSFAILEPEIQKLKRFSNFQKETSAMFCEHIKRLTVAFAEKKDKKSPVQPPSESYQWLLIRVLDSLSVMDALKSMKACLNNDFAFYKRAFGFLRKGMQGGEDQTQENHVLYLFLAAQNAITANLKTELQKIPGYDDVIAGLASFAAEMFETGKLLRCARTGQVRGVFFFL